MKRSVSKQTRNNWLIDAAVFIDGLGAALTGIYFLFLPVGGYQGGRNPYYASRSCSTATPGAICTPGSAC